MIAKGINHFKCSTIAEAELVAQAGGKSVLIAHQLVGPKIVRLSKLIATYPKTFFSSLVDDVQLISRMQHLFTVTGQIAHVYVDVNNGMNRSGAEMEKLPQLVKHLEACDHVELMGWHVYDGHQRAESLTQRADDISQDLKPFFEFVENSPSLPQVIIAGGSPAFPVHAKNLKVLCSPGTSVYWDWGYGDRFAEQPFEYAALVLTRVISKPTEGIITIDLGHKAVAAENPIDKRVRFINLDNYELLSQSEEHGVLKVADWHSIKVGDELLGVPYHVCPTVNLYDNAYAISEEQQIEIWEIAGRKRKITC
jgi:D-serine deaminase-like pyridoxal phosphate-dependent protein